MSDFLKNIKSHEAIKIAYILKHFDINFPSTEIQWKERIRRDVTEDVIKLINFSITTRQNMRDSVLYNNSQYDAYCSGFVGSVTVKRAHFISGTIQELDVKSLTRECQYGARCNVCGFRIHENLINHKNIPSLYNSACICASMFKYSSLSNEEITNILQSWFDVTNKYYTI